MTDVNLSEQGLTAFPELSPETEKLELFANKIKKVPASVGALGKLKLINCFNNSIGLSLPDEIGMLSELEEVNFAANRLAMLKDAHFASWSKVSILNLNDNNLSSIGSLAPMLCLEELRLYGNQLSALPTLPVSAPKLSILEVHKNRIDSAGAPDDYFEATPALTRVSLWGNQLSALPSSLATCAGLVGVQAHANPQLERLPNGPWPSTLETLFVQETALTALPAALAECTALKRVNVSGLKLDGQANDLAAKMEKITLSKPDGIFWDKEGQCKKAPQ